MTTPPDQNPLDELKTEVEEELALAESTDPRHATGAPTVKWLYEDADAERYEVGLHSLLGAVEALETDYRPRHSTTVAGPEQ